MEKEGQNNEESEPVKKEPIKKKAKKEKKKPHLSDKVPRD